VLQYQYCNTLATVVLLQVPATMPRDFKKIKLSGPMKVKRMRDHGLALYQQQVANSEHEDDTRLSMIMPLRTTLQRRVWTQ
jgi:hypothetical protein